MNNLIFKIDPQVEIEYLKYFESATSYYHSMNMMPRDLRRKVIEDGFKANDSEIVKAIETSWEEVGNKDMPRKDVFKKREKDWKVVEADYFKWIQDITDMEWEYKEYSCYGSVYSYPNYYSMRWGRPEILITIDDDNTPNIKIAHELFHAHQVTLFKKYLGDDFLKKTSDEYIEVMLILLFTDKSSIFKLNRDELISERKTALNQDLNKAYDQLVSLWENRTSFKDFMEKTKQKELINLE